MDTEDTAARYDRIAHWWQTQHQDSLYGIPQLERAIQFTHKKQVALDIGCGSSGRFIKVLSEHGFQVEGLDISSEMIDLAKQLHPNIVFYRADICCWNPPKPYSLIVAWDSTFHLPLDMQESVMKKLCNALEPDGVLMFTCGGGHEAGEVSGTFQGQDFEYSTLGVNAFLKILSESQFTSLHLEYDQYPENHVYIIAQKT
ncbi:MAG: class I SAM-dependent methyltransferase [Microcoleus sp. PH2017_01_SCD_O_A]|uniref:class I SAM-dependent methyltransferase n=1 Tax=unclassified Microcoleus TaxID=2642155 RepID=UPI001E0BFB9B|nr:MULTISPECIES: class I SAM-dependent methyltransferase [unclassified Microcoleus]MCC3427773.1 class I SAM-dependent methyltransferase [Microcoleus sp. PH2017_01_SCD_O_A]MCC3586981.1 class I SAM-dependent methyltransferase [Microcoleus sp. PH2017_30_WIL_O_A]MCC3591889.1 class I SAM-dependent methyltransferase [Microcoleus sp. PH2017_28_MFU_U_A]TAG61271.1 MAG: class I SAM-dependent methyltransferase [Oscillatoriales cyanobacterium]